ncbi:MAG: hypothetical protein LBR37_01705 [Erysipelotrichaceae bacterium]|nr:hypothetical protein [Erysipelotrichaceae bacterium]
MDEDVMEGNVEFNTVNTAISPMASGTLDSCNTVTDSHGIGREVGYFVDYLHTGCRHYKNTGYTYGSTDIPFFINQTGMTSAQVASIRSQAAIWNQAKIHDSQEEIVNLYEVYSLGFINGRPVCEILLEDLANQGGQSGTPAEIFSGSRYNVQIKLNINGYNSDTPMHEMVHLMGLNDLDNGQSIPNGTHKSLMGYDNFLVVLQDNCSIKIFKEPH